ncbi:hypothetical protein SSCG_00967 [Streptomyces clavuligerus]|nr:hypothetical protein SSCG_00967 [Streptomyces clavuligerus]
MPGRPSTVCSGTHTSGTPGPCLSGGGPVRRFFGAGVSGPGRLGRGSFGCGSGACGARGLAALGVPVC